MDLVTYSSIVGTLVVIAQALAVIILIILIARLPLPTRVARFFARHGLLLAWVVAIVAFFGSLGYSEIFAFEPCRYCWMQRIAMFPLVILLGVAHLRRELSVLWYALPLCVIGAGIGVYHYLLQFGRISIPASGGCGAVGQSVACNSLYVLQLNYITIPLMALTAFALIAALLGLAWREDRKHV